MLLHFVQTKNFLKIFTPLFVAYLVLSLNSCQKQTIEEKWLARVNDQKISVNEFRMFYELDPNFGLDSIGLPALKAELDKLIDQKLSLQLAQKQNLLDEPTIKKAFDWEKKQSMLRALYRKKIGSKLKISESDLRKTYLQQNERVHVRHLFTTSKEQAQTWFNQVRNDSTLFFQLAQQAFKDSTLKRSGGDLGWIKLAELDEQFIKGIDTLKPGQISRPIKTRWGYHVVQMINRKKPAIIREDDYLKQRPALRKWLRRKWGMEQARSFINSTIGKLNPQPDPKLFFKIWLIIKGNKDIERLNLPQQKILNDQILNSIRQQLESELQLPFIHYKGGNVTLGEFLNMVEQIPITQRPRFKTPKELSLQLAKIFRDDFLYKMAREENLDQDEQVLQEVQRFKEEQLYYYFINQIVDSLSVPVAVKDYFQKHQKKALTQFPELKHLNTLQEWQWQKAEHLLHKRLRQLKPKVEINLDLLKEENKGINWDRRIRMFMIRKPS